MATVSSVSGEEGLIALLGRDLYDYFGDTAAEGGDSTVGGVFPENSCTLESLADDLLQEAYEVFERGRENSTTSILDGKAQFANPKTEDVAAARRASIPKKTQAHTKYCMRLWNEWKAHRNVASTAEI